MFLIIWNFKSGKYINVHLFAEVANLKGPVITFAFVDRQENNLFTE